MSKRLIILGAGESGTGAALLGKAKGYDVFVSDGGVIGEKYKTELKDNEIDFEERGHTEEIILKADLIIKSPGIPYEAEIVVKVLNAAIEVIDEIEFAFRNTQGKIIAITGTNGKTTTTLLTYHLLKNAGFNVSLVGNVGYSFAREVAKKEHDWYVLEASSFQLDGIQSFAPEIGVLLNITPDHLDRYSYSLEKYAASKFRLISRMQQHQSCIYYYDDHLIKKGMETVGVVPKQIRVSLQQKDGMQAFSDGANMSFYLGEHFQIKQSDTSLKGLHNLINTMCAVSAAFLAGVHLDAIREGLKTFKNAPHRLESVAIINGVEFINDSKATNLDSVIYALGSYKGPLIWIAGGIDKGNDYSVVVEEVKKKVKVLICLGKENEKLKRAFSEWVVVKETQNVEEVVSMAYELAVKGDVVLLSPACASFDLFKNYEDRGDQFRKSVIALKRSVEPTEN